MLQKYLLGRISAAAFLVLILIPRVITFTSLVGRIIEDVRQNGDSALLRYTMRFDGVELKASELRANKSEMRAACKSLSGEDINALLKAKGNITKFCRMQKPKSWLREIQRGVFAGEIANPIERVGIYVPSGKYPLPSTVLMCTIPAKVAGVKEIILCSPPNSSGKINPAILAAADLCGVDKIFKVGGAQAIAALAYGTETIPKVDKIVGPGGKYVQEAKRQLFGVVGIDMLAGPSEIAIIADEGANPKFIALDMLAQAEHSPDAKAILITNSEKIANIVSNELLGSGAKKQCEVIYVKNITEAIKKVNEIAPEHLEIECKSKDIIKRIKNAGAISFGNYSAVALGDYCSGINHVLPTAGFARCRAGLSVRDFVKMQGIQIVSKRGFKGISKTAERIAELEGMTMHKNSIERRFKNESKGKC